MAGRTAGTADTAKRYTSGPFIWMLAKLPTDDACPLLNALFPSPRNNACSYNDLIKIKPYC
jgi:hypothetical protein